MWRCTILIAFLTVACERPFVETARPNLVVVDPDLTQVQTAELINLRVQSTSFRQVDQVRVNGEPMVRTEDGRPFWELGISLRLGMNVLELEATDVEGVNRTDSAYAVHLPHRLATNAPPLPLPRGGHALVALSNGEIMAVGGAGRVRGQAQDESFLLPFNGASFGLMRARLHTARTGHTATELPDGSVLVVGGSRVDAPSSVADLVETAELYTQTDAGGEFMEIPVVGQAIRRTDHTAVLRTIDNELYIDLLGGRGDTRYGTEPYFGVRQDIKTLRVDANELVALNTHASAPFLDQPIFGHTQTRVQIGPYFVLGTLFDRGQELNGNIRVDYPIGESVRISDAPGFHTSRTLHAAAPVLNNLLVVFGGQGESTSELAIGMEVLHNHANRFFVMPPVQPIIHRYGHSAVAVSVRQILLVGGFAADGTAIATSEFFTVD